MNRHSNGNGRARYPFLPFYVDDWLSSSAVASFTLEQQGTYLRLLLHQWKATDGQLPKDEQELANLTGLVGPRWSKVGRPVLQRCFEARANGYVNVRLRAEWLHARERSDKAKQSAAERWSSSK